MDYSYIDRNAEVIREKIRRAAAAARRDESEITLLAAVKYAQPEEIRHLHRACGINHMGENRVQQLMEHFSDYEKGDLRLHFIGTLQTNKVKYIIDKVDMIESVDSLKLAAEIDRQAKKHGISMDILCEINSGREENKSGIFPERVLEFCEQIREFSSLNLKGFMTMAPICEKKDDYRKYFSQTYALALDIWTKKLHNIDRPIISMGMSGSFEEAILEGADIVRVGRGFFEK